MKARLLRKVDGMKVGRTYDILEIGFDWSHPKLGQCIRVAYDLNAKTDKYSIVYIPYKGESVFSVEAFTEYFAAVVSGEPQ